MVVRISRAVPVALAALLAAAPGCSDSGSDDDAPADGDDGDTADDDGADDDTADDVADDGTDDDGADDGDGTGDGVFTVQWGPIMVEPAFEETMCVVKRLGNDRDIKVGRFENRLGLASHHMIVYRVAEQLERLEPFQCDPFVDVLDPTNGSPLAVTQRAEETIQLPTGVGVSLPADQMIRVELHFINSTDADLELIATSTFVELPEEEFELEADFLFVGNPDINLPPAPPEPQEPDVITQGPSYLPMPAELSEINIFAITGHQHQYGIDVQVSVAASGEDEGEPIYAPENFQWDEPETTYHEPPIVLPEDGGFRFSCSWQNTSEEEVGFGESVNNEMCFFWAYYYPSQGAKVCFHTDQFGGHDLCCPSDDLRCDLIGMFLNQD